MKHLKTLLAIAAVLSFITFSNGQDEVGFQRLISGVDNQIINLAHVPTSNGAYITASISIDTAFVNRINVTRYDVKGNILLSKEYELENAI